MCRPPDFLQELRLAFPDRAPAIWRLESLPLLQRLPCPHFSAANFPLVLHHPAEAWESPHALTAAGWRSRPWSSFWQGPRVCLLGPENLVARCDLPLLAAAPKVSHSLARAPCAKSVGARFHGESFLWSETALAEAHTAVTKARGHHLEVAALHHYSTAGPEPCCSRVRGVDRWLIDPTHLLRPVPMQSVRCRYAR